ncbi:MAG: prepilin-type N-terminal cleavage/methylation domain-containing protein [Candidatus Saccharimonadales bacterium]|jgi:prepilin-type N-terminal cleavage/methylation domain-containing protein
MRTKLGKHSVGLSSQRGDTIVEVIIAAAIISLVLAVAYGTVNRNVRISQETREQTQAVKIAERQVELLRINYPQGSSNLPDAARPCYAKDDKALVTSPTECVFSGVDGSGADYKVTVMPPSMGESTYVVTVSWETLSASTAKVTMRYIP